MKDNVAIKVENVYKEFKLPHEKTHSIKTSIMTRVRGKKNNTVERQRALQDISFDVKEGEFFGIVGRNGSGKSTLLKIIAEIYQPTKGNVTVKGRLVPFIELGVGFNPDLTGRENIYLSASLMGFSKKEIDGMYDNIVEFAELEKFMDQKLKNYSSGMQVRLAFSIATRAEGDILLVDEVLAVGDADFQRKCFNYFKHLKRLKKTVVFVTHDMNSVREYCDRAMLIEKSQVVVLDNADRVAGKYTRMFIEESSKALLSDENEERWGDGTVQFNSVILSKNTVSDKDTSITIVTKIGVKKAVDGLIVGFSVDNPEGTRLLGTNTQLKFHPIKHLDKGKTVTVTWEIPNIFTSGMYSVNVAAVYDGGTNTADWWDSAAVFEVKKTEPNPYKVLPEITLKVAGGEDK
jgi:ABC-2 type transport system ATP-binding protein